MRAAVLLLCVCVGLFAVTEAQRAKKGKQKAARCPVEATAGGLGEYMNKDDDSQRVADAVKDAVATEMGNVNMKKFKVVKYRRQTVAGTMWWIKLKVKYVEGRAKKQGYVAIKVHEKLDNTIELVDTVEDVQKKDCIDAALFTD